MWYSDGELTLCNCDHRVFSDINVFWVESILWTHGPHTHTNTHQPQEGVCYL